MKPQKIQDIEISLLLEAIFLRYGYDFRGYARASIRRRIVQHLNSTGYDDISEMIPKVLYDESFFSDMVRQFSIGVTEMFRDPGLFLSIRDNVIPLLKSYPSIRIWHAGCSTGEEGYSLAILMHEEGILDRSTIFATDFNDESLSKAKQGIYSFERARMYTQNYQKAGGKNSLSDYYRARYGAMTLIQNLRDSITFANHNLVTDKVFTEAHLILCRNVMIYFNKELQNQVLKLFYESLVNGGFLCLGLKENILLSEYKDMFVVIDPKNKIYQKKL